MPKVEASPEETRNLVAYLSRLKTEPGAKMTLATGELGAGVPFAKVARPEPGTWPTYDGDLSGNRFSALKQIDTTNVGKLAPKWMFTIPGAPRSLEVTPVVVDGVMYVTSVNEAYALDARSGREIWHYSRPRSQGLAGDAASGINRGVAVLGDRVFMVSDNAHLFALHRFTGQLIWDVEMADSRQNYGSTSAPLVVNDLVIAGVSGGDEGVRGFLDAYKASTGEHVWRFWTIPARGEPGSETWSGRALEHGCGATWLTGTYDPEARLLYWPTGNPCPDYNGDERKGDNLYTASVVALDPATGKLKWHYQFTPHDLHDWDATETPVLVDATFRGRAPEAASARESERILLRARPAHRQSSAGRAVRQEDHVGERHRQGRTAGPAARKRADGRGPVGLSRRRGRGKLAVERVQSGVRSVLHVRGRVLQHLQQERPVVGGGQIVLRRRNAARSRRFGRQVSQGDRHSDRQSRMGDARYRRRDSRAAA